MKNLDPVSVKKDGEKAYTIFLEKTLDRVGEIAGKELSLSESKVCIVTDSNVDPLWAEKTVESFLPVCRSVCKYVFPAGEQNKNLEEVENLYRFLIEQEFDRGDVLTALGGGVIGDMTGFTAATYLRGIRFIQIPTTLLSQVDSSIGGKTGVDLAQYKNMVGAFHMPSMVYACTQVLQTLDDEQFASGMGEVLKHGLIRDAAYYEWTIGHMSDLMERDEEALSEMIRRSLCIKRDIVEKDPLEKGERMLLNFGHTIGHAIEKLKDFQLLHGACVSLGCVAAAEISRSRGLIDDEEFYEIRDMMVGFDLPISYDGPSPEQVLDVIRHDKKIRSGKRSFILLEKIGKAFIDTTVTDQEILEAVRLIDADLWET